jgi:hypothetical protein
MSLRIFFYLNIQLIDVDFSARFGFAFASFWRGLQINQASQRKMSV